MINPVKILACVGVIGVTACAVPPIGSEAIGQSSAPQCFLANEVDSYTPGPDGFVNVKVGDGRWFGLHLSSDCPSMDWLMQIAVRPRDSNWLCENQGSYLIAPDPAGLHRSCYVSGIRRLGPGEVASIRPANARQTVRT